MFHLPVVPTMAHSWGCPFLGGNVYLGQICLICVNGRQQEVSRWFICLWRIEEEKNALAWKGAFPCLSTLANVQCPQPWICWLSSDIPRQTGWWIVTVNWLWWECVSAGFIKPLGLYFQWTKKNSMVCFPKEFWWQARLMEVFFFVFFFWRSYATVWWKGSQQGRGFLLPVTVKPTLHFSTYS